MVTNPNRGGEEPPQTTGEKQMNATDKYNEIAKGWKAQTTHDGLTGEAVHGLMHLEEVWYKRHYRDGDDLSKAYDDEVATCVACQSGRA